MWHVILHFIACSVSQYSTPETLKLGVALTQQHHRSMLYQNTEYDSGYRPFPLRAQTITLSFETTCISQILLFSYSIRILYAIQVVHSQDHSLSKITRVACDGWQDHSVEFG
jgi:hypothetical protein